MESNPLFLGQLVLGLGFLLSVLVNIVTIVVMLRRNPPLPEELARDYVRSVDFDEALAGIEARCVREESSRSSIYSRIESVRKEMTDGFRMIERALGRLESRPSSGSPS